MKNEIPRGERVKAVIKSSGFNVSFLAKKLKVHRSTIYTWFEDDNLDFDKIKEIGNAITHDFSKEFPMMASEKPWLNYDEKDQKIKELEDQVSFWSQEVYRMKKAYEALSEKYNMLLAQQNNNLLVAAEPLESWEKKKGA